MQISKKKRKNWSVEVVKKMDSIEDWDFLDYNFINEYTSPDLLLPNNSGREVEFSSGNVVHQEKEFADRDCSRKRGRGGACSKPGAKACREKLRRERLNERFLDLSSILEPGRSVRTDKSVILDDAIKVLTQLRTETQELKETNEKLSEEIKCLKAEKNELREEKLLLKANKEKMEQQLKTTTIPPAGYLPAHPAAYHPGANKMAVFPGYGLVPMWQYLPPSARDTSQDHELRPPAA
ncbi:transcription factor bHLH104-like isoform X2 [Durio zibethinus]|uniref:Transcription factor bHLH104-like isoform X2 n=1 Tax=Durio zibethinus TaxID=66656 RepID=A0A6P5YH72_DURZI|nr:transcription factor bHLH104-like isoform X2 [Durio zibethinus]